jgi:predicted GNAT family acetyltransferase
MNEQQPIDVQHSEDSGRGAFFVAREDIRLAAMTYSRLAPDRVIIEHTEVDSSLRSFGIGRRLLDTMVSWSRTTKTKVIVSCPYAKAQFERDPLIRDVLA